MEFNNQFQQKNQDNIYQNNISLNARLEESKLIGNNFENARMAIHSGVIPKNFNQNILNKTNKLKVYEQIQDVEEYNKDFIVSKLTGEMIKKNDFSHNNMEPFFRGNIKQNTAFESTNSKLESFTGQIKNFRNKDVIQPMFDPSKNVHQVNGTKVYDESINERFIPSKYRTNEQPIQKVNVGPGLDQGYTNIPCGGLNQTNKRDFIMPKTVDQLRVLTNPKKTYKGRVVAGKKELQRGITSKVNKNRPEKYYNNCEGRYFKSVVTPKNTVREKVRAKSTNRQCSTSYTGNASPAKNKRPEKRGLYRKSRNNCYVNSGVRNLVREGSWNANDDQENYGKNSFNLPLNERDTTQKEAEKLNLTTAVKSIIAPIQDLFKNTKKENFIGNPRPNGNFGAQVPKKQTVHDPNNVARTTIKETNIHNTRDGNMSGPKKLMVYDPNDVARTTIKETNIHDNRSGNMNGPKKLPVHDPNDVARTTIKETNIHDSRSGNMSGPSKITVHDPNQVARTTIKETNIHDTRTGNVSNEAKKGKLYHQDEVKKTVKETLEEYDKTVNLRGNNRQTVYDPNDVPQATIKDTNIHNVRTGNVGITGMDKGDGYLSKGVQVHNTNKQFTSDHEYTGHADGDVGKGGGEGYLVTDYEAKQTHKQFTSDNDYTGIADSKDDKPMSYEDAYNAALNFNKEKIAVGRKPTDCNVSMGIGEDSINIDIKKLESDIINIREMNVNKIYSSVPGKIEGRNTNEKVPLTQDINTERIENDILSAFKENPYTQSLSSY
tara:strand:- start:39 stop:2357 length:2319 start_codon:yes stop_codon:yes gene_type:complete